MSITTTLSDDGTTVTIHVSGRFDFAAHQAFLQAYKEHPQGERKFVVDLKNADYMDSSAMGMLLQLREHGARDRATALVNSSEGVREILRIANFDKIFDVA